MNRRAKCDIFVRIFSKGKTNKLFKEEAVLCNRYF